MRIKRNDGHYELSIPLKMHFWSAHFNGVFDGTQTLSQTHTHREKLDDDDGFHSHSLCKKVKVFA